MDISGARDGLATPALAATWRTVGRAAGDLQRVFADRAEDLGIDDLPEFASAQADRYERHWREFEPDDDSGGPSSPLVWPGQHSQAPAWLIATGARVARPSDFESELLATTNHIWRSRYPSNRLLCEAQVVLPSWTLGRALLPGDRFLPAWPAFTPIDTEVLRAYEGLVDHICWLPEGVPPSEMSVTGVLWRLCSLIDGLEPMDDGKPNLRRSFGSLVDRLRGKTEERLQQLIDFGHVADLRNAATHIRSGELCFSDAIDAFGSLNELRDTLHVVTALLFGQINDEVLEATPPIAAYKAIERDISWIDDL